MNKLLLGLVLGAACAAARAELSVIPLPASVQLAEGVFTLGPDAAIQAPDEARAEADYLAALLRAPTGHPLPVGSRRGNIVLALDRGLTALGAEGYRLEITPRGVLLRALRRSGLFHGIQTLRQLLPHAVEQRAAVAGAAWTMPCGVIEDQPRFPWRGVMLDPCRHLLTVEEIKKFVDLMALHKLNVLHWHLTDDQGWRIEIKKYPKLTEVGAWRKESPQRGNRNQGDGQRYGGFLTQAQLKDIVAHAASRHITVVPEIEMPGHASAALAAHPELSCSGGPYTPNAKGGVFAGVYCAGREETFEFLQNVLAEVCELFPGKYIHIGGDEVPKDNWKQCPRCQARIRQEGLEDERELQSYFIRRIEKFINAQGRTLIGWSEIREGGLAQNAVVMDWIGGAAEAASTGHDVIMSPTSHCYLDYYQSTNHATEPKAIGGYVPLSKVYAFEPIPPNLAPAHQSRLLGAQGNLWTEYIPNFKHAQYMLFPRLCALAEVVWSPPGARNWEDFLRRLPVQFQRFDQLGVNYRKGTPERIGE